MSKHSKLIWKLVCIFCGIIGFLSGYFYGHLPHQLTQVDFSWFPSGESVFVLFASIIALVVYLTATYSQIAEEHTRTKRIKLALENEINFNINQVLSIRPECPLEYSALDKVRQTYISEISNYHSFDRLQRLYAEFKYYQIYVGANYLTGKDKTGTVQRQIDLIKSIFRYFDCEILTTQGPDNNSEQDLNALRAIYLELASPRIEEWNITIHNDIRTIFES